MSDQKESSVLFNLKELMSLEEERIHTEESDRKRRADDEARRRAEEEARVRAEAEARVRAEEAAKLEAERRARAEEERVAREREAHALRVRLDAEARERAEQAERQRQHDLQVKTLEAQRRKGVHPGVLAAVALLAIGAGAYGWFGIYEPAQQAAAAKQAETERLAREAAIEKQRLADAAEQLRLDSERKLAEANAAAEKARQDAERAEANRVAAAKRAADDQAQASQSRPKPSKRPAGGEGKRPANDGDDPLAGLDGI
jgi:colicin import membrane protein